ncbi:methyltransferase domain-containing protein [Sphingosinicella sp. LHD-64]|uniref:class I SAM-dependent methyltransferase n=1 Tax=Sphingosinicella sp. LHD-64 TaxID=3072139 RepID=UPI00280F570E|nr:methyltransferase domain-containing protein [Sphingosinicella sp. LHD-64]MDQ8757670.1 methyltransferase domain-containing protein [Sphingosinicella sp. LHD-64]
MGSKGFVRAVLVGAGVAVLALAAIYLVRQFTNPAPPPEAVNDFNPARFVAEGPPLDAPYVVTDYEVVDAMLAMAAVRPEDVVIDLGSGDGRILIAAARSHGARGLGVDIDPARITESNANARAAGVTSRVAFRRQDLFETPLAEANVLTLYLAPEINLRLRPRILAEMRPGTRVVSHDFDMGDWRPNERQMVGTASIYMWIVPANIEGRWTLSRGDRSVTLTLDQRFQDFSGTIAAGGRSTAIERGEITGDLVRFTANFGNGRRIFEGRLDGNRIVSTDPDRPWQAVRAS